MRLNELFDQLKKINLAEREAFDRGQGLDPLLQEFVYDVPSLPDEAKVTRTRQIADYYNSIYNRTHGRVDVAYQQTRKWAMKIYVQNYVQKRRRELGLEESFIDKTVLLNKDVQYVSFTMPQGSKGFVNDGDGGMLEVKFESNGKTLEVRPEDVTVVAESHSHSKCMECGKTPTVEVLWAEGMGHAWFCAKCFAEWKTKDGKGDICSVKKIDNGKAAMKFADNHNPNIKESIVVEATQEEMERYFEQRTRRHINLVKNAAYKLTSAYPELDELLYTVEHHDASKFEEPERTPYISLTWRQKLDNYDSYRTPGMLPKEDENAATLHHITTNPHHPEYWLIDKSQANIDADDRDRSYRVIDATRMPDVAVAEMVADWQAMSQELKKNTAREWYNKQKDVRWRFSPHQEELIDKLLKVFEPQPQVFVESVSESAIDFPKDELPPELWGKKDGKYSLKPKVKEKVLKYIKSYPGRDLMAIAKNIHICGSLATNLYTQYSDFDVHIVVDKEKVKGKEKQDDLVKDVGDWSEKSPADIEGFPCQIYIQMNSSQDYVGDAAWDIQNELWAKGPKISKLTFNPYSYYKDILAEVEKKAKECDVKLGELSRNVIDYASVKDAYKQIPKSGKEPLRALMKKKLKEIEQDIEALSSYKKEWVKKRRSVSQPKSIQQAVTDKRMQEEWEKANAVFKYLAKYDYLLTIKSLEDILEEDEVLDDKDIKAITQVMDIDTDFDGVSPDQKQGEKK